MGSTALDEYCHQIPVTRRLFGRSECNDGLWSFTVIQGVRLFCLGMLALILGLACGVEGPTFSYNGFNSSDVYIVPNSSWIYNANTSSFVLDNAGHYLGVWHNARSRFWYPEPVQMKDPVTTAVKSFEVSFIFQILRLDISHMTTCSKLAFVMASDDVTAGTYHMGFVTNTTGTKYYDSDVHTSGVEFDDSDVHDTLGVEFDDSDVHDTLGVEFDDSDVHDTLGVEFDDSDVHDTFGVEFDTHMNPEFSDPNDTHVGIFLGCMDPTSTFDPVPLFIVTENEDFLSQVWIHCYQVDSRVDIYVSQYGQGKPARPQESKTEVDMSILKENMSIQYFQVKPARPQESKTEVDMSILKEHMSYCFLAGAERDVHVTILVWSPAPPIHNARESFLGVILGVLIAIITVSVVYWIGIPVFTTRVQFFLAHAAGNDETTKNFAEWLYREMKSTWRYKLNLIKVFFDRSSLAMAEDFPEELRRALAITQVGVVIATEEFFERKWPMTELLSFVDSKKKNPTGVKILPLFYKLKADEVRAKLRQGAWDEKWEQMSSECHPMDAKKCRD
jgi:hypothetical protein